MDILLFERRPTMNDCIFCKIIGRELPSTVVYENEDILAFEDINPVAPVHVVVVPKVHISSINELGESDAHYIAKMFLVAKEVAKIKGISEDGFRIINNCGKNGGQTVFHLHLHVIGGKNLGTELI